MGIKVGGEGEGGGGVRGVTAKQDTILIFSPVSYTSKFLIVL